MLHYVHQLVANCVLLLLGAEQVHYSGFLALFRKGATVIDSLLPTTTVTLISYSLPKKNRTTDGKAYWGVSHWKNSEDGGSWGRRWNSEIERGRQWKRVRERGCPTCMDTQVTPDNYTTYGALNSLPLSRSLSLSLSPSLSLSFSLSLSSIHVLIYSINPCMPDHKIIKTKPSHSLSLSLSHTHTHTRTHTMRSGTVHSCDA